MSTDIEILWPADRVPITVLLDDPLPGRNPLWYENPAAGHAREIPNAFVERFADVIDRTGAAGKFSVIPCPGATGCLDSGVLDVPNSVIGEFLDIVRTRIAPRWDISPEMLTHNRALDLTTMRPLDEREDVWAAHQTEETLYPYIARALRILRDVRLEPNGVTSPWAFAKEVEADYQRAMSRALHDVCGVDVGWYFLDADGQSAAAAPRVVLLDASRGRSLVSLISGNQSDFLWRTQMGEEAPLDAMLTADRSSGRFAELFASGQAFAFHTHWQSLFSNGSEAGLHAFEELCGRINGWGDRIRWTPARELALYATARDATQIDVADGTIRFSAPFACPEFTISVPHPDAASTLTAGGTELRKLAPDQPLEEGAWHSDGDRALVCLGLLDGLTLNWESG